MSTVDPLLPVTRAMRAACALVALSALASAAATLWLSRGLAVPSGALDLDALRAREDAAAVVGTLCNGLALAGAVHLFAWTRGAYARAADLAAPVSLTAAQAAAAFFVPGLNLWRPFRLLATLTAALDGARVPPRAPAATDASATHYRESAARAPDDAPLPGVPLGGAWALWWSAWALSLVARVAQRGADTLGALRTALLVDVFSMVALALSAVLFAQVVAGLQARLAERAARLVAAEERP